MSRSKTNELWGRRNLIALVKELFATTSSAILIYQLEWRSCANGFARREFLQLRGDVQSIRTLAEQAQKSASESLGVARLSKGSERIGRLRAGENSSIKCQARRLSASGSADVRPAEAKCLL
jgi:hypothetical protein